MYRKDSTGPMVKTISKVFSQVYYRLMKIVLLSKLTNVDTCRVAFAREYLSVVCFHRSQS